MASQIDICNEALGLLGKLPIVDIDESTPNAQKCKVLWDSARDEALRMGEWNFVTTRVQLVQEFDPPLFGYDYVYTRPADCLRLIRVARYEYELDDETAPKISYRLEGAAILCNEAELFAKYIRSETATGLYDPLFCGFLAANLAAKLAGAFVLGAKVVQTMLELTKYRFAIAAGIDRKEAGPAQRRINSSWRDAR